MEVIGALILFFSWITSNTIARRYDSMAKGVAAARSTNRLYRTLGAIANSTHGIATLVWQVRNTAERNQRDERTPLAAEIEYMRERFQSTRPSARQVHELAEFLAWNIELAEGVPDDESLGQNAMDMFQAAEELRDQVEEREAAAISELENSRAFVRPEQFEAIPAYAEFWKSEALPEIPGLYKQGIDIANQLERRSLDALDRARKQARIAQRAALVLYAVGTLLILWARLPFPS